jgi:hypothetical protein
VAGAGYSGTPLPRKLGIPAGGTVALLGAPEGFGDLLDPLPDGASLRTDLRARPDVVLFFTRDRARLAGQAQRLAEVIHPDGTLWVAWPKRASRVPTDMTEDVVREVCLPLGLVDVKVAALDETWSGLRLVWRKELRSSPVQAGAAEA